MPKKKPSKTPMFKVSKYLLNCYSCNRNGRIPIVIKFNAEIADLGVGICNTYLNCENCGRKGYALIDTWWGGTFENKDTIFESTTKKEKINISDLTDYTKTLSEQYTIKLSDEVSRDKRNLEDKTSKLKKIKEFLKQNTGGK